jgi:hypothetical protein
MPYYGNLRLMIMYVPHVAMVLSVTARKVRAAIPWLPSDFGRSLLAQFNFYFNTPGISLGPAVDFGKYDAQRPQPTLFGP